ncbi:DMT family transporter [Candidatus Peregrinibacteria bacterium]|nr:MAG: DMT family transporter [Candidatus Peregrinibacteria bacterium]
MALFALLGPFLWGFTNVIDTVIRRQFILNDVALVWLVSVARLFLIGAFLLMSGFDYPGLAAFLLMLLSGAIWLLPLILYFKSLEFEEPTRVALMSQMTPLFTLMIAFLFLKETLNATQLIAFIFLMTASALASLKRLQKQWHFSKAIPMILIATFMWAVSDVLFKHIVFHFTSFYSAMAVFLLGGFLAVNALLFIRSTRRLVFKSLANLSLYVWVLIFLTMLAGALGSVAFGYALTLGKASLTAVLLGIQPLVAFSLGFLLKPFVKEIQLEHADRFALLLKGLSFILVMLGLYLINR